MKIFRCDICGENLETYSNLRELLTKFKTDEIKDTCRKCLQKINAYLQAQEDKARERITEDVKKYITEQKINAENKA